MGDKTASLPVSTLAPEACQYAPSGYFVSCTMWTAQVDFTRAVLDRNEGRVIPLATAVMSWPLAKALRDQLSAAIMAYETQVGTPIQVPPTDPNVAPDKPTSH
jgi:hypothetical protein